MWIPNRLKYYRRLLISDDGDIISQRQLGAVTGIDYRRISYFEQGQMVPTDGEVQKLCAFLKVEPHDIYPPEVLRVLLSDNAKSLVVKEPETSGVS